MKIVHEQHQPFVLCTAHMNWMDGAAGRWEERNMYREEEEAERDGEKKTCSELFTKPKIKKKVKTESE